MKKVCLLLIVVFGLFTPKAEAGPGTITSSVCFQFPAGTCNSNGSIIFTLNTQARVIAGGQVVPTTVSVTLDSTGNIPASTSLYANDQLQPKGTFYNVRIYNSNGLLVSGPLIWVIAGASPIDLALITASTGSPDPGLSNPVLQNPAAAQTITGQPLTLTSSAPLAVGAQVTSTVSTGTAPFSIASTTQVPNLNVSQLGGLTPPGSAIVGLTDIQTLTNKTLTSPTSTGTDSGTETLTNKTLTSPIIGTSIVPNAAGTVDIGSTSLPFHALWIGTAATNNFKFIPNATAAQRFIILPDPLMTSVNIGMNGQNLSGVYQAVKGVSGCTTAASIGGICASAITVTWFTAFQDTNYSAGCSPSGAPTNLPSTPYIVSKTNSSITVNYFAITAAAASWATIDCWAIHD